MKTILLMTDFSENARNAINYTINMFGEEAEYLLLNTYIVRENTGSFTSVADTIKEISAKELAKELSSIKEQFSSFVNLKITDIHFRGGAIDGVNALKNNYTIDLIAMGTKGASGITKFLVGSVTASVVKETGLPVLIVPEKEVYKPLQKITFATDFSKGIENGLIKPLQYIAKKFNAELALLNVVAKQNSDNKESQQMIALGKSNYFEGIKTSTVLIEAEGSDVENEIESYCKNNDIDLLTVVAHHNQFFDRLFHKSVSQELIFHAQLPILALDDSFKD